MKKIITLIFVLIVFCASSFNGDTQCVEGVLKEVKYITSLKRDGFSEQFDKTVIIFEDGHTCVLSGIHEIPIGGYIRICKGIFDYPIKIERVKE